MLVRKADWAQAIDEYNKAALSPVTMTKYIEEKNVAVKRQHATMKVCVHTISYSPKRERQIPNFYQLSLRRI